MTVRLERAYFCPDDEGEKNDVRAHKNTYYIYMSKFHNIPFPLRSCPLSLHLFCWGVLMASSVCCGSQNSVRDLMEGTGVDAQQLAGNR